MTFSLSELLPYITTALGGFLGWLWRDHHALAAALAAHRTHVAERYVTKDDMQVSLDRVYSSLDRIEQKLDASSSSSITSRGRPPIYPLT